MTKRDESEQARKGQQTDPYAERKKLSFEQAEGIAPLPSQHQSRQITQEFRAILWRYLSKELEENYSSILGEPALTPPWSIILPDAHVYRYHRLDELSTRYFQAKEALQERVARGEWHDVLGWSEFVMKHRQCPRGFAPRIDDILRYCRLAYRVVDGTVICRITSDAERETIERAFADLANAGFGGARTHLRNAAERLTAGKNAESIRESIHAVESVVRVLEPKGDFSKALARLEAKTNIHGALKAGFGSIYGFTSDEEGIRHPLLDSGSASVDGTDALFMLGACAAFVSYLINKARTAGLL